MIIQMDSQARIKNVDRALHQAIEDVCTLDNPKYKAAMRYSHWGKVSVPQFLKYAKRAGDDIIVPRGFPFGEYREFQSIDVEDRRVSAPVQYPTPMLELYPAQEEAKESIIKANDPQGCYLLVMPTSTGKTITILSTLADLGERALVLTHTDLIYNAWANDYKKLFGGQHEVGTIKRDKFDIGDYVTIASMQTLIRRKHLWKDLWKQIGAIVVDECHISPCPTITAILNSCPAKYKIGITATDKRKDGLHEVLYLLLGKPLVRHEVEEGDTESSLQIKDAVLIPTEFYAEYGEDYHAFIEELMLDDDRNNLIVSKVIEEYNKDKVCLVVTNRRDHANILHEELLINGVSADLLLGGMSKADVKEVVDKYLEGKKGVIVATNKLISTGANIPPLERLFITIPFNDETEVIQLAGRIRRKFPGKEDAILYAFHDVKIPRVNGIIKRVFIRAFQKMQIKKWKDKYF